LQWSLDLFLPQILVKLQNQPKRISYCLLLKNYMKNSIRNSFTILLVSILIVSCGTNPTPIATDIFLSPDPNLQPSIAEHKYLNIALDHTKFLGDVGDTDGIGEIYLLMVVSDGNGHTDALICPYDTPIEVKTGDIVFPCNVGLSYSRNLENGLLHVMFIAFDVDNIELLGEIGIGAVTAGIVTGFESAIESYISAGVITGNAPIVVGAIAFDVVVGLASDHFKKLYEESDLIGSQSFVLSNLNNWETRQQILEYSQDGDVEFAFSVQLSVAPVGKVFPEEPTLYEANNITQEPEISGNLATLTASQVYLREGPGMNFQAVSRYYQRGEKMEVLNIYKDWMYVKSITDGLFGWVYGDWLDTNGIVLGNIPTPMYMPEIVPTLIYILPTKTLEPDNEPSYP
jgi:hypothetical protein